MEETTIIPHFNDMSGVAVTPDKEAEMYESFCVFKTFKHTAVGLEAEMGPTPHPPAWAPCVSVSRPWVRAGARRTGVPPGPSPGTVTNAEQTALGVPKLVRAEPGNVHFAGIFEGRCQTV